MAEIKRIPTVLVYEFLSGASITGVAPAEKSLYTFDYDNEAGGPFQVGEDLSWTGGTGYLAELVDAGTTGNMVIFLATGALPTDNLAITGGVSSATCDVDGDVTAAGISDSVETIKRGRYRRYNYLLDGGLIDISEANAHDGYKVRSILISAPGITAVNMFVIDRHSNAVFAGSETPTAGNAYHDWKDLGLVVAPGCKFQVVGTGTLSAAGRIMFIIDRGWSHDEFDSMPQLGSSNRPPAMQRP